MYEKYEKKETIEMIKNLLDYNKLLHKEMKEILIKINEEEIINKEIFNNLLRELSFRSLIRMTYGEENIKYFEISNKIINIKQELFDNKEEKEQDIIKYNDKYKLYNSILERIKVLKINLEKFKKKKFKYYDYESVSSKIY
jgi:hypothetical protein